MNFSLVTTIKKNIKYIALLSIITFFAYAFSLNNQFVWDDEQFIYNNTYVRNFDIVKIFTQNTIAGAGEQSTYYRPLTTFSFALDHAIWGLNPFGFHLTNTLLHLGAGILLFFYLRTLNFSKLASTTIASIFLVHPIQTEAVVYANSRGDSMYIFWAMISLLSFALLLKKKYPSFTIYDLTITIGKKTLFFIIPISYILSILGKEIGIASLGAIFLTYFFVFYKKIFDTNPVKLIKKYLLESSVLITTGLTSVVYLLIRGYIINIQTTQENYFTGTSYGDSLYVRLHTFTQAIWTYFQLLIAPYPLHMERNLEILEQPVSLWLIATIALFIALLTISIKEYKVNKTGYTAFGTLWFFSMLVPISGIIPINGLIYEHWMYMPIIGFCIALYGIKNTVIKKEWQTKINIILKNILPIIIFIYIALTIRQNYIWANPIRFYTHTLQFAETARLRNNLAMAYANEQDYQNSVDNYYRAIEINDSYPQTHFNLANAYLATNNIELAKKEYSTAIRMNKNFMPAYSSLIQVLIQEKNYSNAEQIIKKLLEITPENIEFQLLHAQVLIRLDKKEEAKIILNKLEKINNMPNRLKILIHNTIKEL